MVGQLKVKIATACSSSPYPANLEPRHRRFCQPLLGTEVWKVLTCGQLATRRMKVTSYIGRQENVISAVSVTV